LAIDKGGFQVKKKLCALVGVSLFIAASPVLAFDHESVEQNSSWGSTMQQQEQRQEGIRAAEQVLANCSQQMTGLHRQISRLQGQIAESHALSKSVLEELKSLEQKLKEANQIVRPLQIF